MTEIGQERTFSPAQITMLTLINVIPRAKMMKAGEINEWLGVLRHPIG
jgi:hypothetical protein